MDKRERSADQDWSPQSHNMEPFRRTRTTKEQAQKDKKKVWKCDLCDKEYQSYPALYTHNKQKHEGSRISSKGKEGNNEHPPVKKLKSILNENSSKREELERTLIRTAKSTCLNLFEVFSKEFQLKSQDLVDSNKPIDLPATIQKALELAQQQQLPQELQRGLQAQIFNEHPTKIGSVSFGKEALKFFAKTNIGGQLLLQFLVIDGAVEGHSIRMGEWEEKIWGRRLNFNWLESEWKEWRETAKKLSSEEIKGPQHC